MSKVLDRVNQLNNISNLSSNGVDFLNLLYSNIRADLHPSFSITSKATGGITYMHQEDGNFYVCHKFLSDGDFILSENVTADILLVAGGGGGGYQVGGGGGAGGLIYRPSKDLSASTYSIVVGLGGNGSPNGSTEGTIGGDSTFGSILTAKGGGRGANHGVVTRAKDGGSGAGGSGNGSSQNESGGTSTQSSQSGDSGTYGFGNAGGEGEASNWSGGGGGGAGTKGEAATLLQAANIGGNGGSGKYYGDKFGTSVGEDGWFAGGGGGCGSTDHRHSYGGRGGGAKGYSNYGYYHKGLTTGDDAISNTGGGGGGVRDFYNGSTNYTRAGNGGSGIIIVRYKVAEYA